jgi:hypothetical protein
MVPSPPPLAPGHFHYRKRLTISTNSRVAVQSDTKGHASFLFLPDSQEKELLGARSIENQQHLFSHEQAAKSKNIN